MHSMEVVNRSADILNANVHPKTVACEISVPLVLISRDYYSAFQKGFQSHSGWSDFVGNKYTTKGLQGEEHLMGC